MDRVAEQLAHADGIPGSDLPGPFPVGAYAAQAARRAAQARARAARSARSGQPALSQAARLLRAARRRRRAAVLDVARRLRPRSRSPDGALADGAQVVVAGGPDYYPGSRTSSPALLLRRHRRCASPARATCSPSSTALRRQLDAEGLFEPQKRAAAPRAAAHDRRRHRRGRQGARRRARRAAPPRLGGPPGVGVRAGAGPPRRAADHARAAGPRGDRARSTSSSSRAAAARSPTCSRSATRRCAGRSRCCACR